MGNKHSKPEQIRPLQLIKSYKPTVLRRPETLYVHFPLKSIWETNWAVLTPDRIWNAILDDIEKERCYIHIASVDEKAHGIVCEVKVTRRCQQHDIFEAGKKVAEEHLYGDPRSSINFSGSRIFPDNMKATQPLYDTDKALPPINLEPSGTAPEPVASTQIPEANPRSRAASATDSRVSSDSFELVASPQIPEARARPRAASAADNRVSGNSFKEIAEGRLSEPRARSLIAYPEPLNIVKESKTNLRASSRPASMINESSDDIRVGRPVNAGGSRYRSPSLPRSLHTDLPPSAMADLRSWANPSKAPSVKSEAKKRVADSSKPIFPATVVNPPVRRSRKSLGKCGVQVTALLDLDKPVPPSPSSSVESMPIPHSLKSQGKRRIEDLRQVNASPGLDHPAHSKMSLLAGKGSISQLSLARKGSDGYPRHNFSIMGPTWLYIVFPLEGIDDENATIEETVAGMHRDVRNDQIGFYMRGKTEDDRFNSLRGRILELFIHEGVTYTRKQLEGFAMERAKNNILTIKSWM